MSLFCLMFFWAGYVNGKRDADRYYAEQVEFHRASYTAWCQSGNGPVYPAREDGVCYAADEPQVKLIPPIKLRTPKPVASIEEPR